MKPGNNKYTLLCFLFFLCLKNLLCQTKEFNISAAAGKIFDSYYNRISVMDSRYDTLDMGFILNNYKKVKLVPGSNFRVMLTSFLGSATDSSAANGELLFQLRKLKFAEKTDVDRETGICFIRATLYSKNKAAYARLADIDTTIVLNLSDATATLLDEAGYCLGGFIRRNLLTPEAGKLEYSYYDVVNLEDHEKKSVKIYTAAGFTDGVYLSWHAFKNQAPDYREAELQYKILGDLKARVKDKDGRKMKITDRDVYAFVDKGVAYVCTAYGNCIVERKNNELFYASGAKPAEENAEFEVTEAVAESLGNNTVQMLAEIRNQKRNYVYFINRIDYLDGTFMRVKKIK